tara:strand:- start:1794 stop:2156 length:363 start_codon:yes stop_codon:yes gene_type:complete
MAFTSLKQQIKSIGELKFGWTTFTISFKKALSSEGEACLGLTDFDKLEIHLDDSMKENALRVTLLHEILHVVFSTMGLRAEDEDSSAELKTTNEFIVESTTRGLLLLRELNPELWNLIYD